MEGLLLAVEGPGLQHGLEHLPGAGGVLDHRALRGQVALQDGDGAVGADGLVEGVDDVLPGGAPLGAVGVALVVEAVGLQLVQVLPQGLARDGHHVQVEHGADLLHDPGHAAGIIEELGGPLAGGADVQQVVRPPVEPVKGVGVDLQAELLGHGGDVEEGVGGAGDGGMDHDGVLKGLHGDDVPGSQALSGQLHNLGAGPVGRLLQVLAGGRHQGRAGEHQAQGLGHDLHGGGGAHEGTGAAGGTGVLLVPGELPGVDLPPLVLGGVDAHLLQGEQVLLDVLHLLTQGIGVHDAAGDHDGGHVHPADAHQVGGHALVAAGDEHAAVKGGGPGMDLDHVADGVPAGQGVVDAVVALGHTVTDVGGEVAGRLAAVVLHAGHRLLHQAQQMGTARVAVAEGALHHDLGLGQVLHRPAHAHAQGVLLRRDGADVLTYHTTHS